MSCDLSSSFPGSSASLVLPFSSSVCSPLASPPDSIPHSDSQHAHHSSSQSSSIPDVSPFICPGRLVDFSVPPPTLHKSLRFDPVHFQVIIEDRELQPASQHHRSNPSRRSRLHTRHSLAVSSRSLPASLVGLSSDSPYHAIAQNLDTLSDRIDAIPEVIQARKNIEELPNSAAAPVFPCHALDSEWPPLLGELQLRLRQFKEKHQFQTDTIRVGVLGGGISGLACARILLALGFSVEIFEGGPEIGGRARWIHFGSSNSPISLGAMFLHSCDQDGENSLYNYLRHHRVLLTPKNDEECAWFDGSGTVPDQAVYACQIIYEAIDKLMLDRALKIYHSPSAERCDISFQDALDESLRILSPHIMELKSDKLRQLLTTRLKNQHAYVAEVKDLSVCDLAVVYERETVEGHHALLPRAFEPVINLLAAGLNIKLNHIVTHIGQSTTDSVVLDYVCDGLNNSQSFDYAVVTCSLGVLKTDAIRFTPQLPTEKQEAIDKMGMGVENRIMLEFEEVFWPAQVHYLRECCSSRYKFFNLHNFGVPNVLIAQCPPPFSVELEDLTDEEVIDNVLDVLRQMFPGQALPRVRHFRVTRWGQESLVRGSYHFIPKGSDPNGDIILRLAKPFGRVFFAGEACSILNGQMVQGAFETGILTAFKIAEQVLQQWERNIETIKQSKIKQDDRENQAEAEERERLARKLPSSTSNSPEQTARLASQAIQSPDTLHSQIQALPKPKTKSKQKRYDQLYHFGQDLDHAKKTLTSGNQDMEEI